MGSKPRCALCRAFAPLPFLGEVRWRIDAARGPAEIVIRDVPALRCACCGRLSRAPDVMRRAELLAAVELADRGVQDGQAFRFMRKSLRLSSSDLADLLDVTRETLSRWENNRFPVDRTAWITVATLVADELAGTTVTMDRLSAFRAYRDSPPRPLVSSFTAAASCESALTASTSTVSLELRRIQDGAAVTPLRRQQQPRDPGARVRPAIGD